MLAAADLTFAPAPRGGRGGQLVRRHWPVALVLIATLAAAVLATRSTRAALEREADLSFRMSCEHIRTTLVENLEGHIQVLQGAAGLFDASSHGVSRAEWRAYTRRLQANQGLAGIQGLGVALGIPAGDLERHTREVCAEGFPDYAIRPPGRRPFYTSIVYLEPFTDRNLRAFGFDMFSEPVRRAAMERARDSGRAALSGKVQLVQETHEDVQSGVLMYVPVYRPGLPLDTVAQRQAALQAWTYSPFRMNDFLSGMLRGREPQLGQRVGFEIYDGPDTRPEALLYRSEPRPVGGRTLTATVDGVGLEWRPWTLRFIQLGGPTSGVGYGRSWAVLGFGLLGSLLTTGLALAWRHAQASARALRASEAMLARTAGISRLGSWELEVGPGTLLWSEQLFHMFGRDPAAGPPSFPEHFDLYHPDDRPGLERAMATVLAEGRPFDMELRIRGAAGQERVCFKHCYAEKGVDGRPVRLHGLLQDITDRKRAEQDLQNSERKFRTLFENLAEGVVLHELVRDAAGRVVDYRLLDANPAFERHTGIASAGAVGRLGTEVYGTPSAPYLEDYSRVAESGEDFAFETYFPPLDKHFRISVVSPRSGQFATLFEDITERRCREEELSRKNAEMERFTYMVSHDLKSPLVTIRTFLGYLEQDLAHGRGERATQDMAYIRDATHRMGELLEDLLEVSRVGRVVNPPVEVEYVELVRSALAVVAGPIAARGVAVQVEGAPLILTGDRARLEEVWQNLVENAVKYMGAQAAPRIEVGIETDGPEPVFLVRDNGIGIDPRFHDRVFGLFEKLDPGSEGTGLGLALVKRIVELHGGSIRLESEGQGRGTCFRFTLPLALKERKGGAGP